MTDREYALMQTLKSARGNPRAHCAVIDSEADELEERNDAVLPIGQLDSAAPSPSGRFRGVVGRYLPLAVHQGRVAPGASLV